MPDIRAAKRGLRLGRAAGEGGNGAILCHFPDRMVAAFRYIQVAVRINRQAAGNLEQGVAAGTIGVAEPPAAHVRPIGQRRHDRVNAGQERHRAIRRDFADGAEFGTWTVPAESTAMPEITKMDSANEIVSGSAPQGGHRGGGSHSTDQTVGPGVP
jgi:hypothetical protein